MPEIQNGRILTTILVVTILVVILDLRHIGFSDVIHFGKFGFPDPKNLGKDILQAKIHRIKALQG